MAFRMDFKSLPRCGAKARSNNNLPCRQAAKKMVMDDVIGTLVDQKNMAYILKQHNYRELNNEAGSMN